MRKGAKQKLDDSFSVAEHARRLRAKPGWDPSPTPADAGCKSNLQQQLDGLKVEENLHDSDLCPDCARLRHDDDDDQALCPRHLALAMGFGHGF